MSLRLRFIGLLFAHRTFLRTRRSLLRVAGESSVSHPRGLWVTAWVRWMREAWRLLRDGGA